MSIEAEVDCVSKEEKDLVSQILDFQPFFSFACFCKFLFGFLGDVFFFLKCGEFFFTLVKF